MSIIPDEVALALAEMEQPGRSDAWAEALHRGHLLREAKAAEAAANERKGRRAAIVSQYIDEQGKGLWSRAFDLSSTRSRAEAESFLLGAVERLIELQAEQDAAHPEPGD